MNLLPLEIFRREIGWNPYHFWGLSNARVPVNSRCNVLLPEYSWQDAQMAGRSDMRAAIERAENRLAEYLRYYPAPKYQEATNIPWPKYHDRQANRRVLMGGDGRRLAIMLPKGYVQSIGVEEITSLGTAAVTLTDENGDGLLDTFTATLGSAVASPDHLHLYFVAADRWDGTGLSDKWEIAPVRVSVGVGTTTVTGASWLLVRPVLYEGVRAPDATLDPDTTSNYASSIEFALKTVDTEGETLETSQAVLYWESEVGANWWFCYPCNYTPATFVPTDSRFDPAAYGYALARCGIRFAEMGQVTPDAAVLNATTGIWQPVAWHYYREPDRATVRYVSGKPLVNREMDKQMASAVWHLAIAELGRMPCSCDTANREFYKWQFDLSRAAGLASEQYQISPSDLNNPFGTARGAVYAWREVKRLALTPAVQFP